MSMLVLYRDDLGVSMVKVSVLIKIHDVSMRPICLTVSRIGGCTNLAH